MFQSKSLNQADFGVKMMTHNLEQEIRTRGRDTKITSWNPREQKFKYSIPEGEKKRLLENPPNKYGLLWRAENVILL